ncbi:hypothetical protein NQ317_016818 [Molorchus minor]|uniref:Uncharacterized protein n=1 Tax=Molorchus minor TaxID=1323400 RepID=A0ABQ9JG59_9CUCU|nr:hypothetical protein NQ317_016818 [Molorchus minor]
MNDTAALVARRGSVKASITRIEKFVDEFGNDVTVNSLKGRLQHLEELYTKYDEIQLNLEVLNQEEFGGEREVIENKYLNLQSSINDLIELKTVSPVVGTGERGWLQVLLIVLPT